VVVVVVAAAAAVMPAVAVAAPAVELAAPCCCCQAHKALHYETWAYMACNQSIADVAPLPSATYLPLAAAMSLLPANPAATVAYAAAMAAVAGTRSSPPTMWREMALAMAWARHKATPHDLAAIKVDKQKMKRLLDNSLNVTLKMLLLTEKSDIENMSDKC